MNLKSSLILTAIMSYLLIALLGNVNANVCAIEQGAIRIEFGLADCGSGPVQSTSKSDCGDCSDIKLKSSDTPRITSNRVLDLPESHVALICPITEHKKLSAYFDTEQKAPLPALLASSILII